MTITTRGVLYAAILGSVACAPAIQRGTAASGVAPISGTRVYAVGAGSFLSVATLRERLAGAGVVMFGEQHDDPATHDAELAVARALAERRGAVVLSLEMFERDVQQVLDGYLAGRLSEEEFLAQSRPWPRYTTDYRPLVELAKSRGWRVIAANVPRRIASEVSRRGLAALDSLSATDRGFAARDISCPLDRYYERFAAQMQSHGPGSGGDPASELATLNRYYEAQCLKDETMAESIVSALAGAGPGAIVLHVNGAFHSDFRLGTTARVERRIPEARVSVLTAIPVADPATADTTGLAGRADYVIFTQRAATQRFSPTSPLILTSLTRSIIVPS